VALSVCRCLVQVYKPIKDAVSLKSIGGNGLLLVFGCWVSSVGGSDWFLGVGCRLLDE
jgi:hypothetical protein